MNQFSSVPCFTVNLERKGGSYHLSVPWTFGSVLRYERLRTFLGKAGWQAPQVPPTLLPATRGAATVSEIQAAELAFVRDSLGWARDGRPVPEKDAARMLRIGVKALHHRCSNLFGMSWAQFVQGGFNLPLAPSAVPDTPASAASSGSWAQTADLPEISVSALGWDDDTEFMYLLRELDCSPLLLQ